MSQNDNAEEKGIRAYDLLHMEIEPRVRHFFEQERSQHHRISLNRVVERTVSATGINKNLIEKLAC